MQWRYWQPNPIGGFMKHHIRLLEPYFQPISAALLVLSLINLGSAGATLVIGNQIAFHTIAVMMTSAIATMTYINVNLLGDAKKIWLEEFHEIHIYETRINVENLHKKSVFLLCLPLIVNIVLTMFTILYR
jgi:hypothetical protein